MKKFLEKSHLYFLLFYFAVGDFIAYYNETNDIWQYKKLFVYILILLFFVCLVVFDIFILLSCKKYSLRCALKPMLVINIYFAFCYYINFPEMFIFQEQNWKGLWQLFSLPFYIDDGNDSVFLIIRIAMACFFILTVVNIILLYVKRKPKTIEDNKKL